MVYWKNSNDIRIFWHDVIINFFDVVFFLLSSLVTGSSFISISSLVLELWQFPFIRDWPEIWKSEITTSEFCPISGGWGKIGMPNLTGTFQIKCYWMLQNAKVVYSIISFKRTQLCRTTKPHVICKKKQISKPLVQLSTVLDHLISSSHVVWSPLFDISPF